MTMLLRTRRISPVSTRSLLRATAGALAAAIGLAATVVRRVVVEGDSMRPTLLPGDRVVALRCSRAAPGQLVVLDDPRLPSRRLVKRVAAVGPEGFTVRGDAPASTDSRSFGPVPSVWGRVVYRYSPTSRAGRLDGSPGTGGYHADMEDALDLERLLDPGYLAGLAEMPMDELRRRKAECGRAEAALSYLRRLVQVRLDIVVGEMTRRAEGGTGELSEIIEQLPEILAEGGTRTLTGRLTSLDLPDVNHRVLTSELDRIFDVGRAALLSEMDGAAVRQLADRMDELERRVSGQRRALHERLDKLQAEVVRRYKTGEASIDGLFE